MATEYCFTVNGMRRTTTEKKSLLRYLRDDLHLFSVKDGCSEGACGTCTIIVDGVAVKACVLTTDKSVGRNIVTVEGLTEREQDAFVYAFGCNGVQREHNKKLNNGLPILHKVPPKRDYGRYFCIMAEKGGTSHGGLTEKLSLFFHAKKQEVNAYGR